MYDYNTKYKRHRMSSIYDYNVIEDLESLSKLYATMSSAASYKINRVSVPGINKIVFNDPATIVIWADNTKTVVKAAEDEPYDPEKGLAMAIAKKALGNEGNYYNVFKKWLPKDKEDILND